MPENIQSQQIVRTMQSFYGNVGGAHGQRWFENFNSGRKNLNTLLSLHLQ
jgi:hypothetical protein